MPAQESGHHISSIYSLLSADENTGGDTLNMVSGFLFHVCSFEQERAGRFPAPYTNSYGVCIPVSIVVVPLGLSPLPIT